MDPSIVSYQHVRPTWLSYLKQKYSNGKWCGLTFGVCPKCLKIFHFIPAAFTLAPLAGVCLVKFSKTFKTCCWKLYDSELINEYIFY